MPYIDRAQRILDIQEQVFLLALAHGARGVSRRAVAERLGLSEPALRRSFGGDLDEMGVRWVQLRQRFRFMQHDPEPAGDEVWAYATRHAFRYLPVDDDRRDDAVVWTRLLDANQDRDWARRRFDMERTFFERVADAVTVRPEQWLLTVNLLHGVTRAVVVGACTPAEARSTLLAFVTGLDPARLRGDGASAA